MDLEQAEERARQSMSAQAFGYIAGGAGHETTMRANRTGFDRWRIVPRMLRDVAQRDTSVELFGRRLPSPFLTAPIGVLEMAHRQADLAVARAAAAEGVPMVFSNQASVAMEETAGAMGDAARWFQLYWSTSNELVESFAGRAEACGCEAIVVTLDTTILGWRQRDLDLAYLPFLRGKGIAQYTSDPVFARLVAEAADAPQTSPTPQPKPTPSAVWTLLQILRKKVSRGDVQRFIEIYSRPSLRWEDLPFLRERTKLPILLKGILHPDDARRAVDAGIDGVIVSNHGGRQVDGAIATIEALPGVVEAVGGSVPVLMDSGVRGGADAFKALALGARAVLIGRPYVYGLAIAGEDGVREVLQNFKADFDLTMGLAGCRSVAEIGPETLVRA
jgi:isopentenyl diphosphate isomerase/L-lactate dehydrogenase-like FMN-dependent dehydrogenase